MKREIVTMGEPDIDPVGAAGTYVAPEDWNALIADPDTVVIDTRNDYEVRIGSFARRGRPGTASFRDFPPGSAPTATLLAGKRVAMFCTGGIRCEKATAFAHAEGVDEVYHLKGGILSYLETVPPEDSLWQGECFVFDAAGRGRPRAGGGHPRAVPRLPHAGERGRPCVAAATSRASLPGVSRRSRRRAARRLCRARATGRGSRRAATRMSGRPREPIACRPRKALRRTGKGETMPALDVPPPPCMRDPELEMLADSAGKFFERNAPPERVAGWREAGQVERAFWRAGGRGGAARRGDPGRIWRRRRRFPARRGAGRAVAKHGVDGFALSLHNVIILPYILAHGTEEQKRRWLPKLCSGERVSAIAMSEPGAGSDLQSIRTTALKDGNGYRINGAKTFISNGQIADLIVVVAKTDPAQGGKGVSLLVVETDEVEGFRRGKALDKIGQDAQDTSELFFDDVWVPRDNLLGPEEGKGFLQLMAELPRERLIIAVGSIQTMDKAIAATTDYVRERKAFGQRGVRFPEHPVQARRSQGQGDRRRGVRQRLYRAPDGRHARPDHRRDRQAVGVRDRVGDPRRLPAAPRRLWLYQRLSDRADVAERAGPAAVRRDERDHEGADRAHAL